LTARSNEQWIADLSRPGPGRDIALSDLRDLLLRGLRYALSTRSKIGDDDLEDWVQVALLRILDALNSFRGESRFTTWAQKIAVRVAFSELRRSRWKDVSLNKVIQVPDGEFVPETFSDPEAGPEQRAIQEIVLQVLRQTISQELTEKQRNALVATHIHGMSIEEVARRMDTNRNALYKLLHDARRRLQKALQERGLSAQDILSSFGA
jgi:RNA polymerase sigma-70 factor (ECF subfamily)